MRGTLDKAEVGRRIRTARESLHMSREQLAERVPMSHSFLQDVEGGTKGLSMEKFYRLVQVLDVSADYLLGLDQETVPGSEKRRIIFEKARADMDRCDTASLQALADMIRTFTYAVTRVPGEEREDRPGNVNSL